MKKVVCWKQTRGFTENGGIPFRISTQHFIHMQFQPSRNITIKQFQNGLKKKKEIELVKKTSARRCSEEQQF